jgi:hypothetical protein
MTESSLIKKLGIKPSQKMLILNAPEGYIQTLGTLPAGNEVKAAAGGAFDFVQLFVRNKADIDNHAATAMQSLKPGGLLWFTYPKKSSSIKTDITRDIGWDALMAAGIRPVTQIAIDDTWSALRFRPTSEVKSGNKT